MARNHYSRKPGAANHPHLSKLLDAPFPEEEQKEALIRKLEAEHGPVVGRWIRSIGIEHLGLHFQNGSTKVLERSVFPPSAWSVKAEESYV